MSTRTLPLDASAAGDGDLLLTRTPVGTTLGLLLVGDDAIAQHLRMRLRLVRGEWFLDLDAGTDYPGVIWKKGATDAQVAAELKRVILGTDGVAALRAFALTRDNTSRTATVTFDAQLDTGALIKLTEVFA
ncbi:MAG: hypothetical protein ACYC6M_13545 [Terriglobales bacterium]